VSRPPHADRKRIIARPGGERYDNRPRSLYDFPSFRHATHDGTHAEQHQPVGPSGPDHRLSRHTMNPQASSGLRVRYFCTCSGKAGTAYHTTMRPLHHRDADRLDVVILVQAVLAAVLADARSLTPPWGTWMPPPPPLMDTDPNLRRGRSCWPRRYRASRRKRTSRTRCHYPGDGLVQVIVGHVARMGPNISSRKTRMSVVTLVSTVGKK
jgi:hypothetical protein